MNYLTAKWREMNWSAEWKKIFLNPLSWELKYFGWSKWLTLGKMSTGLTRLLARDGSFFSKAGSKIEASRHNEEMQVLSVVMNSQSPYMKYWFLDRVRLGHIFFSDYPCAPQCSQLVQIVPMGNPTFLNPKISGSSQQGYGGIFVTNYVSISFFSASLCSELCGDQSLWAA